MIFQKDDTEEFRQRHTSPHRCPLISVKHSDARLCRWDNGVPMIGANFGNKQPWRICVILK